MGLNLFRRFRKKEPEDLDLAELYKRGLLREKEEKDSGSAESAADSGLGFLGNLAQAETKRHEISKNSPAQLSAPLSETGKEKLKNILRELRDKTDSLFKKTYNISDRIDLLEKKVERLERKPVI